MFHKFQYFCYLCTHNFILFALVAELVDALDLGSSVFQRVGSSPIWRTK